MTKRRTRGEMEAAAYHEAGHAVVAYFLGWPIEAASIRRRKNTGGYIKGQSRKTGEEAIVELEFVLLAGPEAEGLYIWLWGTEEQKSAAANGPPGARDDLKRFAEIEGKDLGREDDRHQLIEEIARFSSRIRAVISLPLLSCTWHMVAAELLRNHSLDGEQIGLLIERAERALEGIAFIHPGILARSRDG